MISLATEKLSPAEKLFAAKNFAETWKDRGNEKSDTQQFWLELLEKVVGMKDTTTNVIFEAKTSQRGYIDVWIPDAKTFIEQKSITVDLDKADIRQGQTVTAFRQALNYANTMQFSQRPRYIITSNFQEFRIYDLDKENAEANFLSFTLAELPEQIYLLDFLIDPQRARAVREEKVSMDAGQLVGKLYDALRTQYLEPDTDESQHSLNVLCVRLVFCLFAEDAGLFEKDAFFRYLNGLRHDQVRTALLELFKVLNTPVDQRDPYLSDQLKAFPYVNGGLFAKEEQIPHFTEEILDLLLNEVSQKTNWSQISPTIFGGVFESTLNPETRAKGGMHYTSPENIHKVIDPLFLDGLKAELTNIIEEPGVSANKRKKNLEAFHDKIANLNFFDPACGSGNFLTETYIHLRKLENKILSELAGDQTQLGFSDVTQKVSLNQFHGIEINDFAVSVASTALWIAQLQANIEAETIVTTNIESLPLHDAAHIHHGNALRTDWDLVIAPEKCSYIIGNPPFLGARNQSKEQKTELIEVFPAGTKNVGNIDYVAGWFMRAAQFMGDNPIRTAFVATNSICQGEQVANIWYPITKLGFHINFAHDTFRWVNEASDQAHVFCVIVGFSKQDDQVRLYHYEGPDAGPEVQLPSRLNPYLVDAPDAFIWNRSKPISNVPLIGIGNKPIDGGHYLFTEDEKAQFLQQEPNAEPFFHPWIGAVEFLQGKKRWVLWLGEVTGSELRSMPLSRERIQRVKEFRETSKSASTRKLAEKPHRFHVENFPTGYSIIVPEVSSERRKYIPLGFIGPEIICSNLVKLIPNASLFEFGVLHSQFHNSWMRAVAGRLENRYRYSGGVVYNNFVFPEADEKTRMDVEKRAHAVLDARELYPDATLADLYDPSNEFLYPDLMEAHRELDKAVEIAYGVNFGGADRAIVEHLFKLHNSRIEN